MKKREMNRRGEEMEEKRREETSKNSRLFR